MQKQAVLVCIVCALAALLTIGITLVLIHRGKEPAASSEQPGTEQPADDANIADHYQINEQSSALLPETATRVRRCSSAIPTRCVCMLTA